MLGSEQTGPPTGTKVLLTCHLHDVPRHNVPGLDPLDALAVLAVNLPHLRFVLLQRFNGVFCISLLSGRNSAEVKKVLRT